MRGGWDGSLARFRVDDLKDICRKAGLQVTGTKTLLIQRIKRGLKDDTSSRILMAIRKVHERIEVRLMQRVERRQWERTTRRNSAPISSSRQNDLVTSSRNHHFNVNQHQGTVEYPVGTVEYSVGHNFSDSGPITMSDETDESVLHRGEKDPFLTVLSQVGNVFRLLGGGYNVEVAASSAVILDVAQMENIKKDATMLVLRSFKLKPNTGEGLKWEERGHLWPLDTKVLVNGRKCEINQRKILWQGTHRKIRGSCGIADISKLCFEGVNLLRISCLDIDSYGFVVQFVKKQSVEDVMEDINKRSDSGDGLQRAIDSFKKGNGGDGESAVSATSMSLSLKCPLGLTTINVPSQGVKCTHLQCFDLEIFLRYCANGSESTWRCAVCHKPMDPHEVVIDQFMKNIVDEVKKKVGSDGESIDEVHIFDDGRWELARMKSQKHCSKSRKRKLSQLLQSSFVSQQQLNTAAAAATTTTTAPASTTIFPIIPQLNPQLNKQPGSLPVNEVVDLSLDADSPNLTPNPAPPICEVSNSPILPINLLPPEPTLSDNADQMNFGLDNMDANIDLDLLEALRLFQDR